MNNIVLIESPYRNNDRNRNLRYLAWCEFHSSSVGEVPIASHGNCTAYWPEDEEHRLKGFAWRDAVRGACDYVIFYTDLGMSEGQQLAEIRDGERGVRCIRRKLPEDLFAKFESGEYPPGSMMRIALPPPVLAGDKSADSRSLRASEWIEYRATDSNGVLCGHPVLHTSWNIPGILLELEARGYLPFRPAPYNAVRDGNQIRVESDGLVLLLVPTGC
jgi:hypothetical protein